MSFTTGIALLLTSLAFPGCALPVASERPITITMGPSERVRQICTAALGRTATGCLLREGDRLVVFCPYNDTRCLARELDHASPTTSDQSIAENSGNASR
jgi:hypothetical protein